MSFNPLTNHPPEWVIPALCHPNPPTPQEQEQEQAIVSLDYKSSNTARKIQHLTKPKLPIKKRGRKSLDRSHLICYHCEATVTPEWRRGPNGKNTLCNACGLQYSKVLKAERRRQERHANPLNRMKITYILNGNC